MTRKEIEALNWEIVTLEQLLAIMKHEEVDRVESNGNSGNIIGATWHTVYFTDEEEIDIYFKD